LDDLMQEARIGFLYGCSRFDPAFGVKVPTYALSWARQRMMLCALRARVVHLPPHSDTNRVTYHARRVAAELGTRDPAAVLHALGLRPSERLLEAVRFTLRGRDAELGLDLAVDADGPDVLLDRERVRARVQAALASLPERLRMVVLRRQAGERLRVIGEDLGVSRERVRQIEMEAYQLLREVLG
jgi:RNA polymerase sigma factor (sigma-70 family)